MCGRTCQNCASVPIVPVFCCRQENQKVRIKTRIITSETHLCLDRLELCHSSNSSSFKLRPFFFFTINNLPFLGSLVYSYSAAHHSLRVVLHSGSGGLFCRCRFGTLRSCAQFFSFPIHNCSFLSSSVYSNSAASHSLWGSDCRLADRRGFSFYICNTIVADGSLQIRDACRTDTTHSPNLNIKRNSLQS